MKKLASLRNLLLTCVPALASDPSQLEIYTDKGSVNANGTRALSYEVAYTATIWIQSYAGDTDALFVPLLAWIDANQPDLLDRTDHKPFTFESEILDADTCDIAIEIELTERVVVSRRGDGTLGTAYQPDNRPLRLADDATGATPWRGLLDDQVTGDGPVPE